MMMLEVDKKYVVYSEEKNKLTIFQVFKLGDDLIFECQEENNEYKTFEFDDFKTKFDGSVWLGLL